MNPDGTHQMQITDPGARNLDTNQNWSPDGTQIVYEHDTADGSSSIWVVGALGASPRQIVPCPGTGVLANCVGVFNPSWSPDACSGRSMQTATRPTTRSGPSIRTARGFARSRTRSAARPLDQNPQWSADSGRIAFQRNQAPQFKPQVWTADSTTGGDLVSVSPPGVNGGDHPDYSPDGRWIMFRTDNGVPGSAKVLMAHPDGTGLRVLLDGSNRQQFFSSGFSPDGTAFTIGIAPGAGPDGNADVFVGEFDSHMRVTSLTNITNTDIWESSPRRGTAPLLH